MTLTEAEKGSAVWQKLKAHYAARLDGLRRQNDTDKPETQTIMLRGRIAEIKTLLDIENPKPIIEEE